MTHLRTILLIVLLLIGSGCAFGADIVQTLFDITFNQNQQQEHGWRADRGCRMIINNQILRIEATQVQPQIFRRAEHVGGEFKLIIELRTGTESEATLSWITAGSPRYNEINKVVLPLHENDEWTAYEFLFTVPDKLTNMMLQFSVPDGSWEIRSIKLLRKSRPPLSIKDTVPYMHEGEEKIKFTISNDLSVTMTYTIGKQPETQTLERGQTDELVAPIRPIGNLAAVPLTLQPYDFPPIVSPLFLYRPDGKTDWIQKSVGDKTIEIAPDGRMARLLQNGEVFGIIAPLVHRSGVIPKFTLKDDSTESELRFESEDVDLRISIAAPLVNFEIIDKLENSNAPLEGPAVRLFGKLRSGLLPGVEFLKEGDTSSSTIDIERPFNNRSLPNPLWITMPLAVLETEKGGAALYWEDASLQPTFSSPNRFDHENDHRMSLIGSQIKASLELFAPPLPQEEAASFRAIRSYVAQKGFPSLPPALRTVEEQNQLSAQALAGALQSVGGGQWGYAFEDKWKREAFADMISTSARLTEAAGGRFKNPTLLVPGGADITNDAIFFLSGRIQEWQQNRETAIREIMAMVNPDGSFMFRTRFPELETAASSYGYTALKTLAIMEYVRATGNDELFAVVKKALTYLEQCDIPCGGFYLDTPFHTPDLQTAATLVWLYVWAYEYSGNTDYLERAKHFAFAGLPFVYQTTQKDHMLYGTVGKFGGTNRRLPLHFGLMSTRIGIQYAYALTLLSKHDRETEWKTVAKGIMLAVENLQYTEGIESGCIPELFDVVEQEHRGWKVNPCALVSLRWAIEGKVDSLFVLTDGKDRYTAPYPLRKTAKGIEAYDVPQGQKFHILHNANRYGTGEGNGVITVD
jgi:hypothetical protein